MNTKYKWFTWQTPNDSNSLFKWLYFFIKPYKTSFFLFSLNRIVISALFFVTPLIIKKAIDHANSWWLKSNDKYLFYLFLILFWIHIIAYFLQLLRTKEFMLHDFIKRQFCLYATEYSVNLPLNWHENQWAWNKIQKIITARDAWQDIMRIYFNNVLEYTWKLIMMFIILYLTTPPIFLLLFFIYTFSYVFIWYLTSHKIIKWIDLVNEYYENILWKIYEFVSSINTIKFLNLLPFVKEKAWEAETKQRNNLHKLLKVIFWRWFILNNIANLFFLAIAFYSSHLLINNAIQAWTFVMILWYAWDVWWLIDKFWSIQEEFYEKRNWFMRIRWIFNEKIENLDIKPIKPYPNKWNKIEFKNVSYAYRKNNDVLKSINLLINKWESIALVWRSWSGKSTFIKLFMKQVLTNTWWIFIDSININNIPKKDVIENTAVVLQNTELFNISIKDNILIKTGKWDIDLENINKKVSKKDKYILDNVLKLSHSKEFVVNLPEWIDTIIWERWVKLSGWEKQRIWIARALAQNTEIIVFDEATSSLDSQSEKEIQKAIKELFEKKTTIVIAHRLSTVKQADRILVFDKWKIIEDWDFKYLINKKWIFAKLWKLQKLD